MTTTHRHRFTTCSPVGAQAMLTPYEIHTDPGTGGAMAPPADWQGTAEDYREFARLKFRDDASARQHMLIAMRRIDRDAHRSPVQFAGQYADIARDLLLKGATQLRAMIHTDHPRA